MAFVAKKLLPVLSELICSKKTYLNLLLRNKCLENLEDS
jgi:hypothetical protein